MPNTLAHIAVQTLTTRGILRDADFKWILAGCVLPDIPWIVQRAATVLVPEIPAIPLRLYVAVQSSLLVTLILGAALALLSRRPGRTFVILAFGVVMHLLLDATQTKWANGALFFAPFSWDLANFGLYWPESPISLGLSVTGVAVALHALWAVQPVRGRPVLRPTTRSVLAGALMLVWLSLPVVLMPGAKRADLHFAATLEAGAQRLGKAIEFDRTPMRIGPDGVARLRAWTGETFVLQGAVPHDAEVVSVRGQFVAADTVKIDAVFVHRPAWRAILSQLGLLFVAGWWLRCLRRRK